MTSNLSRRDILKAAAAMMLWQVSDGEELVDFADLDTFRVENHAATPRVKFFDLRHLSSWKTPEEEFFIFHQTETPVVTITDWRLRIHGFVERPREYTFAEIQERRDK